MSKKTNSSFTVHHSPLKKVLVTGASGAIAPILIPELIAKGYEVSCLVRKEPPANLLPKQVKLIIGDLRDEKVLQKVCENSQIIFHLAAKLHLSNPTEDLRAEYEEINVSATRKMLEFSRKTCEKFIFFSTINVYGASDGVQIFDETSSLNPVGLYAETKVAAEKFVAAEKNGVVLRLAAVYGTRMKGNYLKLFEAIRRNRFVFIGKSENRRTLIHEQDVVKAATLAAENQHLTGQIYNLTSGEIPTFREIVEAMSAALGKHPPKIKLPLRLITNGFGLVKKTGDFIGRDLSFGKKMLEKLTEDIAVSGEKLKRESGFMPNFDLKKGWHQIAGERLKEKP